eukprot:TRINITY_DN9836_c0_g2_i1.p1 TRINITY_DN9836_c0_g2~~TRINITY_DN9836_c0_g2_i1.p1  ORF type:complete len:219 (+),score=53.15 TRINITY_DN9836_c0_g2_i1:1-657(+)
MRQLGSSVNSNNSSWRSSNSDFYPHRMNDAPITSSSLGFFSRSTPAGTPAYSVDTLMAPDEIFENSVRAGNDDMIRSPSSNWIRHMQTVSRHSIIISEILDSHTRGLVSESRISDYVLSNEIVSMALAMVSEDRGINRVLKELFSEAGTELYIRQGLLYFRDGENLSWFELMTRARQRRELAIGYRLANTEVAIMNPENKSERKYWSANDSIVVLAND